MGRHKREPSTERVITTSELDRQKLARKKELNEAWDKLCASHGADPNDVNKVVGRDRLVKPLTIDPATQGLKQALIKRGSGVLFQILRPETAPIRSMASATVSENPDSDLQEDLEQFNPTSKRNRRVV